MIISENGCKFLVQIRSYVLSYLLCKFELSQFLTFLVIHDEK